MCAVTLFEKIMIPCQLFMFDMSYVLMARVAFGDDYDATITLS